MATYVNFNTGRTDIEHGISPPMKQAVTIPLEVEHDRKRVNGVTLYICSGAFAPAIAEDVFKKIVERVVEQLEAREG